MVGQIIEFLQKEDRLVSVPELTHKLGLHPSVLNAKLSMLKKSGKVMETTMEQLLREGK